MTRKRLNTKNVSAMVLKRRIRHRKYYHENKEKHRQYMFKYLYGIDLKQYQEIEDGQNGVCAICGEFPSPRKGHITALLPDHNHTTGKVRALLCHRCNVALGKIEKNPALTIKMFEYLDKHKN